MNHYYSVLEVTPDVTQEKIKEQYHLLSSIYQPERYRDAKERKYVEERLNALNEAYNALVNFGETDRNQLVTVNETSVATLEDKKKNISKVEIVSSQLGVSTHMLRSIGTIATVAVVISMLAWFSSLLTQEEVAAGAAPIIPIALPNEQFDEQLAFTVSESQESSIYLASDDGDGLRSLGVEGRSPVWSPTNQYVAYIDHDEMGMDQIFVFDSETNTVQQLTKTFGLKSEPVWSPNGLLLGFITSDLSGLATTNSSYLGSHSPGILQIVEIGSGETHALTDETQGLVQNFVWHPNSYHIIFDLFDQGESRIYQTTINRSELYEVTGFASWTPAINADGNKLGIASEEGIYIYALDQLANDAAKGPTAVQISDSPTWSPTWSYDNSQIAFLSHGDSQSTSSLRLWVSDSDGMNPVQIANDSVLDYAWSPNHNKIAYITGNIHVEPYYLWVVSPGERPELIAEVNEAHISWAY